MPWKVSLQYMEINILGSIYFTCHRNISCKGAQIMSSDCLTSSKIVPFRHRTAHFSPEMCFD